MTKSDHNQIECRRLMELLDALRPFLHDDSPAFRDLSSRLGKLPEQKNVTPLMAEQELETISVDIRSMWLSHVHQVSDTCFSSPPHEQIKSLPSGKQVQFDYERTGRARVLENRCRKFSSPLDGWRSEHVLFSSGMGALSVIIQICAARLDGAHPDKPVKLDMFGGYFET